MTYVTQDELRQSLGIIGKKKISLRVNLTMQVEDMGNLITEAERLGISPTAFVRMAVLEKLVEVRMAVLEKLAETEMQKVYREG